MLKAVLRDMRAHPGRIAMTLVAIVLGVTFVVATWVVSDSAAETVANGASRSDVAAVVRPEQRDGKLTRADRDRLAAVPGVTRASGVQIGYTAPVKTDGKLGDTVIPDEGGTGWDTSDRFALVSGRGPAAPGEIAVEEVAAADAGYQIGANARLLQQDGGYTTAKVVGIYTYRVAGASEPIPVVAYDQGVAAHMFGDSLAAIELYGGDQAAIGAKAKELMGQGFSVKTEAELAKERQEQAGQEAQLVRNFLLAFAAVALLAGMFVIANTFTMLVAQRTRHFALLRAVGARRRQVRRAVLAEAAVLGVLGSTLGAALGVGLAWLTMTLLRAPGETILFAVSPLALFAGYLVGVLVTVIAAYGSARRGAAVPPVAALGTDAALPRRSLVIRTVSGVTAVIAGTTAVIATSGDALSKADRITGMAGAMIAWMGLLLLAPLLATAVLKPLSRLASRSGSAVSRLAVRNAIRDPRRTAATASALMIGLALVTSFATVGESLVASMTAGVRAEVPAGATIVKGAQDWFQIPEAVVDRARHVSGVDSVAVVTQGEGYINGNHLPITMIDGKYAGYDLSHGALLSAAFAKRNNIKVGDQVTLQAEPKGELTATVTGIYGPDTLLNGIVVQKSLLPKEVTHWLDGVYVTGPDPAALHTAMVKAYEDRPDVVVLDRDGLIVQYTKPLDTILGIIYALLGAAVVIAIFGVVNTLALSVLERQREIGVFRAVGASRRLVRRTIRRESVVIASYGGLLGVGVGVLLGGVMQHIIRTAPIFDLAVPLPLVGGALLGMAVVGVLAALWPARRAAKIDVLEAIATV